MLLTVVISFGKIRMESTKPLTSRGPVKLYETLLVRNLEEESAFSYPVLMVNRFAWKNSDQSASALCLACAVFDSQVPKNQTVVMNGKNCE